MTVHLAKGLEFPYVYIVGLEENLFPSAMNLNSRTELEEERRLFYVALTRAEKKIYLSYVLSRYRWGKPVDSEKSRFIDEIKDHLHSFPLIALNFPVFADGRPYTAARELRQNLNFCGEIRAIGDVLRDQIFYMSQCGFDSFL